MNSTVGAYGSLEDDGGHSGPNHSTNTNAHTQTGDVGTGTGGGKATVISCSINLTNTIVGAGMLGLPGAFGGTGWLAGLLLIVISASFSAHGLVLLSKAAQAAGLPSSFYSVALAAVPQYTVLIDLAVALKCFGVATGYLITIGDCMVDALDHILLNGDPENDERVIVRLLLARNFWVVGAVLAVLPFSFKKTLDELKKASAAALVFVFMLAGGIIAYASGVADPCEGFNGMGDCRGDVVAVTNASSMISKLPIFIFAFTCQQNIFPVVNEISFRSQSRINLVIVFSIGFALILFTIVAIEGYRTYGSNVMGDILSNYPETGKVTFLRICVAFMLALHYPLQLDPARRCISSLLEVTKEWWRGRNQGKLGHHHPEYIHRHQSAGIEMRDNNEEGGDFYYHHQGSPVKVNRLYDMSQLSLEKNHPPDKDNAFFYTITISFLLLSWAIAMTVDDLGVVLAMVGATGSTLVSYVLPGLIFIKSHKYRDGSLFCAYVQLIAGLLIMPLALYFVVTGKTKGH